MINSSNLKLLDIDLNVFWNRVGGSLQQSTQGNALHLKRRYKTFFAALAPIVGM